LHRNCLLKHVLERKTVGMLEVRGRRGRRCKQLFDGLKGGKKGIAVNLKKTL
jgi:hypothetical protein